MGCLCFKAAAITNEVNPSNQTGLSGKSSKPLVAVSTKEQPSSSPANTDDEAVIARAKSRRKAPDTNGLQITIDMKASAAVNRTKKGGSHQRRATVADANREEEIVVRTDRKEDIGSEIVGAVPSAFSGDHTAPGWPTWLSSVSSEVVRGWSPRQADSFEKLDKVMGLQFGKYTFNRKIVQFYPHEMRKLIQDRQMKIGLAKPSGNNTTPSKKLMEMVLKKVVKQAH